jgi:hypothetical protein
MHSVEGKLNLPAHHQKEIFWIKINTQRRVFAWRHLETGQYVAQSGLHLHQTELQTCEENKMKSCEELRIADGFTISLI